MSQLKHVSGLEEARLDGRSLHLAIGMFDGVHLGHQAVIEAAVQSARRSGGQSAVLTFDPHPSALLNPGQRTRLILDQRSKARILERLGVETLVTQKFDAGYAAIEATEFLPELQRRLPSLSGIYVGENWRFGQGRRGDIGMLVREARGRGISVFSAPRVNLDGEPLSSTRVREHLSAGEIESANRALGYSYFAEGTIGPGRGLGRQLGFPTLNLGWNPDLQPRFGVYAVRVIQGERAFDGIANYGVRPTVETGAAARLEVHVLGDCPFGRGDLVTVEWLRFIRPERKFSGPVELADQIRRDIATVR